MFSSEETDMILVTDSSQDCLQRASVVASVISCSAQISDSRWEGMQWTLDGYLVTDTILDVVLDLTSVGLLSANIMNVFSSVFSLSQDALQEMYNQEGIFPGQQFKPPRRPWTLLNFLFWATVLLSPLFTFGFGVFASGSPLLILAFLGLVGAGNKSKEDTETKVTITESIISNKFCVLINKNGAYRKVLNLIQIQAGLPSYFRQCL